MNSAVIVPTYNERDNLPSLLEELLALPVGLRVIVVDDGSPDGTGEIADRWASDTGRVQVIHRPRKMGLGTAYVAGFKQAISEDFDRILTMDADFSHPPRFIPAMLALSAEHDLVIGSRYVPNGRAVNSPLRRRLLSRCANGFSRLTLRLPARDCTAGFRCYRRNLLQAIDFDAIVSNGYSFLIEMLYLVHQGRFSVGEVPIEFVDRRLGQSKISKAEITRALQTVCRLTMRSLSLGSHCPDHGLLRHGGCQSVSAPFPQLGGRR